VQSNILLFFEGEHNAKTGTQEFFSIQFNDCLINYGFTSRPRIFHLYGDVTIASEGL
jgi:hypothetical protein